MKISHLKIENYLGIEALDINFEDAKNIKIFGGNGKGKTSILNAIENALNSTAERRPEIVRGGAENALLLMKLDDGTEIKRVFEADGANKIEVKKDGMKINKPETFLKNLFGGFTFNPIDFMLQKEKEQTEILLNVIPYEVTPEMCYEWFGECPGVNYKQHGLKVLQELSEKYFFNKRATANADVKSVNNQIEAITKQLPDNYNHAEWEHVNISGLYENIEAANKVNSFIDEANRLIDGIETTKENIKNKYKVIIKELEEAREKEVEEVTAETKKEIEKNNIRIAEYKKMIEELEAKNKFIENVSIKKNIFSIQYLSSEKIKEMQQKEKVEISDAENRVEKANAYIMSNTKKDVEKMKQDAENVEKMKGYIQLSKNKKALLTELDEKIATAQKYDKYVEFCRNEPKEIIKATKLPIEGLGINDEGYITINERPIKNLSTAEQMDIAISIAKITAGDLKIICIDRMESMDPEMIEMFMQKTADDEFSYIFTKVTSGNLKIEKDLQNV